MSTVKISELPVIPRLNSDTTKTLIAGVDVDAGVTGKMTAKVLAQSLYSNDVLNVGNNAVIFPGVVAQFVSDNPSYLQVNLENNNKVGTADYVITGDVGTDTTNYLDIGFTNSNYDNTIEDNSIGTAVDPLSGYFYIQGDGTANGNLVIGTTGTGTETRFIAGGGDNTNISAKITDSSLVLLNNTTLTFTDGTVQNTAAAPATTTEVIFGKTNAVFIQSNTVFGKVNSAFTAANSAGSYANSAYSRANTAADSAITAITNASTADGKASAAFNAANTAQGMAASAFVKANNALANTTGTFGGTLTVAGDFNVNGTSDFFGNTIFQNAKSDANIGMVQIIGNTTGTSRPASGNGVLLHITSSDGQKAEILQDCFGTGTYNLFLGRMARGNVAYPTAVQTNDVLVKFGGNGYSDTGYTLPGGAYIQYVATENWTDAHKGTMIQFGVTPTGSNTVATSMTLSDGTVAVTGSFSAAKGFIQTPRVEPNNSTLTIDFANDAIVKANLSGSFSIGFTNYTAGKTVEVWLVNTSGSTQTITHGCSDTNSTVNSTTFTMPSTSSAHLKYFSIDGDLANTFVKVSHA